MVKELQAGGGWVCSADDYFINEEGEYGAFFFLLFFSLPSTNDLSTKGMFMTPRQLVQLMNGHALGLL
jgi:hypothetical protein